MREKLWRSLNKRGTRGSIICKEENHGLKEDNSEEESKEEVGVTKLVGQNSGKACSCRFSSRLSSKLLGISVVSCVCVFLYHFMRINANICDLKVVGWGGCVCIVCSLSRSN